MCAGWTDDLGKGEWRARLAAARRGLPPARRVSEARALVDAVASMSLPETVCCYVPFGTEPGSVAWLDVLRDKGARVLLPVIPPAPAALEWAEYTGPQALSPGRLRGVLEPVSARLAPASLREAGLVLVPALAVDHAGARLGRGAGYYDRSLPHAAEDATLAAVVRDDELVQHLPAEPHDIRMTAALTPGLGLVPLPIP
ncbi:5-formyltetrahydrofolate cyclo-ligase [Amycolatopsis alkalitolerans]|uniref:5-formyltetrahydrofolate cyclo-ligase n=1 Tax=Amycolatopsis alkalitolerans TaxID=2547244 RepID=A0A5C4M1R7_9PSEU|nr:5-formyltetrahydrofolate cyclo-ligase [Amycolatopsis alkalitolerans]TNC23697.1 5-formyltetrahydrofolate cyclo-ligase [Amycolatopsis alkalitolerans]